MRAIDLTFPKISGRLGCFDELKGIGILLLLLYHAGGVLVWNNYLHGDLGTDVFFLVSGLCLSLNASRMEVREFVARRVLRILPAYWIVLTCYAVLNQVFLQHDYSPANLAVHYLGVHALFGDAWGFAINDSFWFITAILFFYGCFLAMRRLLAKTDRFLLTAAIFSTGGALLLFFLDQSGLTGRWGFRMIDFFLGMLIGQGFRTGRLEIPLTPVLGAALLILLYVPYTRGIVFHPGVVALGVMGAYLLALRPWLHRTGEGVRLTGTLGWLGRHSLEIFLIHQPLMREYNRYLHGRWLNRAEPSDAELIIGIALSLAVTLVLSAELHKCTRWLVGKIAHGPMAAAAGPTGRKESQSGGEAGGSGDEPAGRERKVVQADRPSRGKAGAGSSPAFPAESAEK